MLIAFEHLHIIVYKVASESSTIFHKVASYFTSHKKFSEGKQVHVEMEASKPTKLDGNDTTTLSHHPYILCHFATGCTNMICVFL